MTDIDPAPTAPPAPDVDQAAIMAGLIRQCCDQLRHGSMMPDLLPDGLTAEHARAVSELGRVTAKLRSKNISLTMGLDLLRDGFAVFGPDLRLIHSNRSFRNFFGNKVRIDPGVHFHFLVDAVERHNLIDLTSSDAGAWARLAMGGNGQTQLLRFTNGSVFRWYVRTDELGNLVCMASEVTSEVRRQNQLEQLMAEVQRATDAKSSFLAHMSHELRTPMNGVIGMAELLCDSGLEPEHQRYAETIRNSAEALLGIIYDILDYSRGRSERIQLQESDFDLDAITVEVMTLLLPAARAKGLDLRIFFDPLTPVRWIGDVGRVRQILVNLVGNAVKYTTEGWVRLQILAGGDGVNILVHDSGPGIPDEKTDEIFDEFGQLNEPGVTGISGSGLGLAITAQLVAAMGGRLWLCSTPGKGSTFGATLPLRPARVTETRDPRTAMLMARMPPIIAIQKGGVLWRHTHRVLTATGLNYDLHESVDSAEAALLAGASASLIILFADDDAPEVADQLAALRKAAPDTPIWLLHPASASSSCAGLVDRMITLPVTRTELMGYAGELLAAQAGNIPPQMIAPPTPITTTMPLRQMRIVVADDNATNRLVVEKMLRHCDVKLFPVENGQMALDMWSEIRPDLILMDVSMPVMDGREATQMIRRIEQQHGLPRTPIVAVTAAVSDEDRAGVLQAGMDEVLTKPLRRASLIQQINAFAPADAGPLVTATAQGSS